LVYLYLGDAYYKLRKGGEAVNNYDLALQYDATLIQALSRTGDIWTEAQRFPEALAAYEKALASDPNYAPALKGLSNLYYLTRQYDKAKENFDKYLLVGELNDDLRYRQLDLSYRMKDYQDVKTQATDLLKRDPTKAKLKRLIAYTDYELGNYDEGMKMLNEFLNSADTSLINADDYKYLARFQKRLGNDSLAAMNYEMALKKDSTQKELYDTLATMYYAKKNYTKAAYYYDMKISKSTKPVLQDYFALGRAYYFAANYAFADSAFGKVTEINATWPIGHLWRARAVQSLDNPEKPEGLATAYFQKVIETASTDSVKYKKELAEAYKYFGDLSVLKDQDYDAALKFYNRALEINPDYADVKETVRAINEARKQKKP
jgi:tetratricopeptide (TPR) repeat protein